jgi:hypothetical protein
VVANNREAAAKNAAVSRVVASNREAANNTAVSRVGADKATLRTAAGGDSRRFLTTDKITKGQ